MNPHLFIKGLRYFITSGHKYGHGIHSPFLFSLVKDVFRNKMPASVVSKAEAIRRDMLMCNEEVEFRDLGAGSKVMKKDTRRVSDIARYSAVTPKYGSLLASLAGRFGNGYIVELGTSLGVSTAYLACGSPQSEVVSAEGCCKVAELANANFRKAGIENAKSVCSDFNSFIEQLVSEKRKPGVIFIDGDHRGESLLKYAARLEPLISPETVLIIDDIYLNKEMTEAWGELKSQGKVSCSVDLFRVGLLFYRKGMSRQEYIIRY